MPLYLPLASLDNCHSCGKSEGLRLCSGCGEAAYCSQECQKKAWAAHGKICGKTDKISLQSFHPFLACLAEICHNRVPSHPALMCQIDNDVNPGTPATKLNNGKSAKLLMLGDFIEPEDHEKGLTWMPKAKTIKIQGKMRRRIIREGYNMQIAMAMCLALASAIYTTTSSKKSRKRRVRLHYGSAPIADFGICVGSVLVQDYDKLAYSFVGEEPDEEPLMGQDPDEHYVVYFTTVRGETIYVDFGMFTFNSTYIVDTKPYLPAALSAEFPNAPVFFRDREVRKNLPGLFTERKHVSILRNEIVKEVFSDPFLYSDTSISDMGLDRLIAVMDKIAEKPSSGFDAETMKKFTHLQCKHLHAVIDSEHWKTFTEDFDLCIEQDPGEADALHENRKALEKEVKRWKRDYNKMEREKGSGDSSGPSK